MKDSYLFLLMAIVAISPHMSKGFGLLTWAVNFAFFLILFFTGK
jgi:hypothetical protein